MKFACIDMEGVLIPEMWPYLAEKFMLADLALTTRELPDYPALVAQRIKVLRAANITLSDINREINRLDILPGAGSFIQRLKHDYEIIIVSDAFIQMISPFLQKLSVEHYRCHHFICDADDYIIGSEYARKKGKHEVIDELRSAYPGCEIIAVGDALNDITMLQKSQQGFLFNPSPVTLKHAQDINVVYSYQEIIDKLYGKPLYGQVL